MSSPKPSSGGKPGVAEVATTDEQTKAGKFGRGMIAMIFVVGVILGAALGAGLASHVLESEFKNIVTKLQADPSSAILETQSNYNKCQSSLSDEIRSREEEVAKLRIHADQNERAFQHSLQQYLEETNAAYNVTNEALERASSRLKKDVEKYESEQQRLNGALQTVRNALAESMKELEESNYERDRAKDQLKHLRSELDAAEEELDRRDVERAECDAHYRDLVALKQNSAQLTEIIEQKDQLSRQVQLMTEKDALYAEIDMKSKTSERERVYWETQATSMIEKIKFRNRKEVLEEFGPGPFFVKLTFAFQDSTENESVLIELAPLDLMPHTVHMILKMASKKLLSQATFLTAKSHILVLGPRDSYNRDNNAVLRDRMNYEGYFPNGALLFGEFTPEYPHTQYTVSFNKLRGPTFYINLKDNTRFHHSYYADDGRYMEGDTCFGKIVEGVDVIQRVLSMKKNSDGELETAVYLVDSQVVNVTE